MEKDINKELTTDTHYVLRYYAIPAILRTIVKVNKTNEYKYKGLIFLSSCWAFPSGGWFFNLIDLIKTLFVAFKYD